MNLRVLSLSSAVLAILLAPSCMFFRVLDYEDQAEQIRAAAHISGRVDTEGAAQGPLVVILGRLGEEAADPAATAAQLTGVDSYVRVRPGSYKFIVSPGRYQIGAWEDKNSNGLLDPGERACRPGDGAVLELEPGGRAEFDVVIAKGATQSAGSLDVLGIVARSVPEQGQYSLGALSVRGELCEDLGAVKFGPESGTKGLWEPIDFLNDGLAGIYLMEPYDPKRVPVLFVHGITGYPQQFATLMESIDRARCQPWFYFYPSAFPIDGIADHLATLISEQQVLLGFDRLAIVAHSMGGLVSRSAIFKYYEKTGRDDIQLFMTFSTPWSGAESARMAKDALIELPAVFQDLNPSSDFLHRMFYADDGRNVIRPLPTGVDFHMVCGFHMPDSGDIADDGVVTLASLLRVEAQEQARTIRAWDYEHVAILDSPEAIARMRLLLAQRF